MSHFSLASSPPLKRADNQFSCGIFKINTSVSIFLTSEMEIKAVFLNKDWKGNFSNCILNVY